jgi:dTDP-4-dehydrorhamnose 3,5-epimerase
LQTLELASANVDVIIHCAAITPHFGKAKGMEKINTTGTRNVVEVANKNRVKRLVYISSEASYAYPLNDIIFEDDPIGGVDNYGKCKAKGEEIVLNIVKSRTEYLILRPAQIYGKGDSSPFTNRVLMMLQKPRIICPINRYSGISMIHIDDVSEGIYRAAISPETKNQCYNVSSSRRISLSEIAEELASFLERKPKKIFLPVILIRVLLSIRWFFLAIKFKEVRPIVKTYGKRTLTGSLLLGGPHFSHEKLKNQIGFEAKISIKDGFKHLL